MAKMGRPTDSPKVFGMRTLLDKETQDMLVHCAKAKGMSKGAIVREGVKLVYTLLTCTNAGNEADECRLRFSATNGPCELTIPLPKILQSVFGNWKGGDLK